MIQVFVGFDSRQPVAAQVAAHSVWQHATAPVSITRLQLNQLPITRKGLTEFTYSRFLVPWLSCFEGTSIFMDSDVLVRGDVVELLAYPMAYPDVPVFVVPHAKAFERPSVMVFNGPLCRQLTDKYVQWDLLFDMAWASKVGDLPKDWNHLVGYDTPNQNAKLAHFTMGLPCWPETADCEFADEWKKAVRETISTVSYQDLMGRSVHDQHVQERLAGSRA